MNKIDYIGADLNRFKNKNKRESVVRYNATELMSKLLEDISPVNFRQLSELEDDEHIPMRYYVTICINELVKIAERNNWGLTNQHGLIYLYNNKYWQGIDHENFKVFLLEAACRMGINKNEGYKFAEELFKQFLVSKVFPVQEQCNTLINLANGTYEFGSSCRLREHRREDFLRYILDFEYEPNAKAPLFDKYLHRVLPDESCRKVLSEYIGYTFTTSLKLEKSLILLGDGCNGKSVFYDIINALLGRDNVCAYDMESITKDDGYKRAELDGKLLNYCSELSSKMNVAQFKKLVSSEPIEARRIRKDPYMMTKYAKLMFNCNKLPTDVELTNAFFRRFIIIRFPVTIPKTEIDIHLAEKIISQELSGVFNWVLDGLRRLLEQGGFTNSKSIEEETERYKLESDSVAMYIEDSEIESSTENIISLKELYGEYRTFCFDNGYCKCSLKTFSQRLQKNFIMTKRNIGKVVFCEKK